VADYVLAGYGTGAVMGVPAHDTRDFAFAKKYNIPIKVVIHPDEHTKLIVNEMTDAYIEYGPMVNSDRFNGLKGKEAVEAVTKNAEEKGIGRSQKQYRLKDWSISRQRYWGCPIPIVHCKKCGLVPVPEDELPVLLPEVDNFMPRGRSPLADVPEFMNVKCPKCGGEAQRDPDTMDTFVCSSWYFLRYLDAHNEREPFSKDTNRWMPIDLYVGGITHATGHLIYFRFFQKFLKDIGRTKDDEPVVRMFNHGMVMDAEGDIMSKSKGNVVSPVALMNERGIDISRLGMYFTAPSDREVLWSSDTLTGVEKFVINRFYPLINRFNDSNPNLKKHFKKGGLSETDWNLYIKLNQTIKRVQDSFEQLQFNTAISSLMELVRDYEQAKPEGEFNDYIILKAAQLIAPMAPHLAEEMWEEFGFSGSIFKSNWPEYDPDAILGDMIVIAIQVNGKLRDSVTVPTNSEQASVEKAAFDSPKVKAFTDNKELVKKIYVPGRILNIVVK